MPQSSNIEITGVVVCYNEQDHIGRCVRSLDEYCREVIVIDLGSEDDSRLIAEEAGARVVRKEWVPIVEHIREAAAAEATTEWIVFLDPDEVMEGANEGTLGRLIEMHPNAAGFMIPRDFFVGKERVRTTIWGPGQEKPVFLNRFRIAWNARIHEGLEPIDGTELVSSVTSAPDVRITHHWVSSYSELLEKHRRYITFEGKRMRDRGMSFSWLRMAREVAKSMARNLVVRKGVIGGLQGWILTGIHVWYVMCQWMALKRAEEA